MEPDRQWRADYVLRQLPRLRSAAITFRTSAEYWQAAMETEVDHADDFTFRRHNNLLSVNNIQQHQSEKKASVMAAPTVVPAWRWREPDDH